MTCFILPSGKTVCQWCREKGVSYQSVYGYLNKGLEPKKACMKAKRNRGNRKAHTKHYYMGKPLSDILGGSWTKAYSDVMNAYNRGYKIEEAVKKFGINKKIDYISGKNAVSVEKPS